MLFQVAYASLVLILLIKPVLGDGYFQCKEQELQALLEIKQELVDEYGRLSSWKSETDCCRNWRGVRCSNRTGRVVMLDLGSALLSASGGGTFRTMLRGNISLSLLKLRHLKHLDLSGNYFGGSPILDFKGALENLRYVNFSWSSFGGLLSYQFANLSRLQSLDLSYISGLRYRPNNIQWLSSLTSLWVLDLSYLRLDRVKDLFQVVNTLPYLKELRLRGCDLSIDLPKSLIPSGLSLQVVDLSSNNFTTSVFSWLLGFSTSLRVVHLYNNHLDGFIPESMGNLTSLIDLRLSSNKLKGGIPKSFGRRLCSLKSLHLSDNFLDGDLAVLVGNISGCMEKSLEILDLYSNSLYGSLPDISIFTNLREVDLYNNQLNGSLPEKFMHPSKLEHLNLRNNQLIGSIPDVVMLPFLKELFVTDNRLNGFVSQSIGSLSNLEVLDISDNFLQGTMSEPHFYNLSKLKRLDLSNNSLTLMLSQSWIPPFQLDSLGLKSCKQESDLFPQWIQTQKDCASLDVSYAGMFDTVPRWLLDFSSSLGILDLSSNRLNGKLSDMPMKVSRALHTINMSSNNFEGELPLFPGNIQSLDLSRNKFSGNLSVLCSTTTKSLIELDLSHNMLTGQIPDCFSQWEDLGLLNLANNNIFGEIPFSIGSLLSIGNLDLHNNFFHGSLPSSLSHCQMLEFMDLSDNNLSGTLPAWIGQNLSSLIFLSLKSNHISGVFPQDFCNLMYIQILDLAINNISGVIPQCIYNLTAMVKAENSSSTLDTWYNVYSDSGATRKDYHVNTALVRWKGREYSYRTNLGLLRIIDLSSNRITGEIPSEITRLMALTALNLSRNRLFGKIPGKIGDMKQIQSLDLSNNHLSSEIPSSLSELTFLSYLDLSNNNLSGRIPTGTQIEGFNDSVFAHNFGLCGKPLETECPGDNTTEEQENPEKEDSDENDDDEFWTRFYAGIGLGFVIGFWGICIVPMLKRQWRVSYLGFLDYLILKFHILISRFKNSRS